MKMSHKTTKNILLTTLALCMCVALSACASTTTKPKADPNQVVRMQEYATSDAGIYYTTNADNARDQKIKYYDNKKKESIPLCDKVDTTQDSTNCPATLLATYKGGTLAQMGMYQNKLYLVYQKSDGNSPAQYDIAVADSNGKNRKHIVSMPSNQLIGVTYLYHHHVFMIVSTTGGMEKDEQGSQSAAPGYILYDYDTTTKKLKKIEQTKVDETTEYFTILGFQGDELYYVHADTAKNNKPVTIYNIKTGKSKNIAQNANITEGTLYKGEIYYIDGETHQIKAFTISKNKTRVVKTYKPHAGTLYLNDSNGLLSMSYVTDANTEKAIGYKQVYDVKKGAFVFKDYQTSYTLSSAYKDGYIGDKNYIQTGLFDKNMHFTPLK